MTFDEVRQLMQPGDVLDLADLLNRPTWMRHAACKGMTELFFTERGQSVEPAKAICAACVVAEECEAYALDLGPTAQGVWAGTTGRSRRLHSAA